jgi:hypothetical protein
MHTSGKAKFRNTALTSYLETSISMCNNNTIVMDMKCGEINIELPKFFTFLFYMKKEAIYGYNILKVVFAIKVLQIFPSLIIHALTFLDVTTVETSVTILLLNARTDPCQRDVIIASRQST